MRRESLGLAALATSVSLAFANGCAPAAPAPAPKVATQPAATAPPAPAAPTESPESAAPTTSADPAPSDSPAERMTEPPVASAPAAPVASGTAPPTETPGRSPTPGAGAKTAPPDPASLSADEAARRGTEVFEREGDPDGAVPYYHAALKKDPKQREALGQLADVQRLRAMRALEDDREKEARATLDEAAAVVRTLRDAYPELTKRERETLQQVLFIEAGFLARSNDPAAALDSLNAAVAAGFEGFDLVAVDPDFASVRALPGYAALAARPLKQQIEAAQQAAAERIAAFEPVAFSLAWPTLAGADANPDAWSARPTLVVFISSENRPSALQLAEASEAKKLSGVTDLAIVVVADLPDDAQRNAVSRLVEPIGADAMLILDKAAIDSLAQAAPGAVARPTTYLLDRAGRARIKYEGWQSAVKLAGAVKAVEATTGADAKPTE